MLPADENFTLQEFSKFVKGKRFNNVVIQS